MRYVAVPNDIPVAERPRVSRPLFHALFVTALLLSLVGCGSDKEKTPRRPNEQAEVPMSPAEREAFLQHFVLLDAQGEPKAATIPGSGINPFGVVLKLPQSGRVTACSVSHLTEGNVVTNAHCMAGYASMGREGFFLVFYNQRGEKRHYPVEQLGYLGNKESDDFAVLKISVEAASQWDTARGVVRSTADGIAARPPISRPVMVWGFDPIDSRPDWRARYPGHGMGFSPKQCLASRTLPQVLGVTPEGERRDIVAGGPAKEAQHIFVDECSRPPVNGNSGSLITFAESPSELLGVYHWGVGPTSDALSRFRQFEYTGNRGSLVTYQTSTVQREFFGVGSVFENFFKDGTGPFF